MANGSGKLVRGKKKAAVAGDREHRDVAAGVLRAKRGRITPAEIVLIARRQKGSRLVDRKQQPRGKTDLGDFIDEDAILGQLGADRVEKPDLRRELRQSPAHLGLPVLHFRRGGTDGHGRRARRSGRSGIGPASPMRAAAGGADRSGSSGSASTRMMARPGSMPHCVKP